jgi:hypothetical protein
MACIDGEWATTDDDIERSVERYSRCLTSCFVIVTPGFLRWHRPTAPRRWARRRSAPEGSTPLSRSATSIALSAGSNPVPATSGYGPWIRLRTCPRAISMRLVNGFVNVGLAYRVIADPSRHAAWSEPAKFNQQDS